MAIATAMNTATPPATPIIKNKLGPEEEEEGLLTSVITTDELTTG